MSDSDGVARSSGESPERRPSEAALTRAGELLYRALERLAIEDAEKAAREVDE